MLMSTARRTTVYIDSDLYRALRLKAARVNKRISALISDAVRQNLAEDAKDLSAFRTRAEEPSLRFENFVRGLRRRGRL